ncbi:MAG: bifunctional precorrin-2 dehydrogenase/sirohydrochlorin ferrochelatase [Deltaproteobacteria bacterium]|nr:bifunctional precorrin-2 dehydrogenase/sirohydrochlorin ferrochelatase [Deltaproteobacteria bacterium]MBW2634766.1 bifunctional precorrin-2 dehydrogenase/sirohydrochlorin ferrochelatase [Deltaproteobacteria bacterium]MBW2677188.1 bifunctional precorrin-2 dehydrogenase/sirohydrochlorin ferrochelatase [Deltaproteobacteria bacterium]
MKYFPVFLDINARNCLVIGGGSVGTRKALALVESGANVTVISPAVTDTLKSLARRGTINLKTRTYCSADMEGMFLVFGATNQETLNRQIYQDAERLNMLCNIADRPAVCNFILPATVKRGDLVIAISTSGKSPAFAKELRKHLETQFGDEYATLLTLMGGIRSLLLKEKHAPEEHKPIFNRIIQSGIIDLIKADKKEEIDTLLRIILGDGYKFDDLMGLDHG